MKFLSNLGTKLIRLDEKISNYFGEGIHAAFSIMAFFSVTSGLFLGLLRRGWLAAWVFVLIGLLFALFPCVYLYRSSKKKQEEETPIPEELPPPPPTPAPPRKKFELDEATKKAIELEAALARKRILEAEAKRQEALKREEERKEQEARREAERLYREKIRQRQRTAEKRYQEERKQSSFNGSYFKQEKFRENPTTAKSPVITSEFFRGVTNRTELKKRYLDLLKIYHPDNPSGDPSITRRVQEEYKELSAFYEAYEKHTPK
ncbi:hypothetical protein D7X88_04530 [bacterium C-53]|nr:hypothetical protein [Lachnospiraceae bacterium]NBI02492.1 hypothetical protein [Lachnospiraceae bacterium]RKJ11587.1 hypothetical protein D7X88_04530 [bacterium C-53]